MGFSFTCQYICTYIQEMFRDAAHRRFDLTKSLAENRLDYSRFSDHASVIPIARYFRPSKYNGAGFTSILSELAFVGRMSMNRICSTNAGTMRCARFVEG
jgi:hypothetical protein